MRTTMKRIILIVASASCDIPNAQHCPPFFTCFSRKGGRARLKNRSEMKHIRSMLIVASALLLMMLVSEPSNAQRFGNWEIPTNIGTPINSPSLEGCPFISKDGLTLYFASNRASGFGGNDIYFAHRENVDEDWGTPVNLGPTINTSSDEVCPTLSVDSHHLYFVSSRAGGCGGQDLYVSRRQYKHEENWEAPENLGCQLNSAQNDFSPSLFEDDGGMLNLYFSSNRVGGLGGVDIYVSTFDETSQLFAPANNVVELNATADDQRPNVRQRDGLEIFFESNRSGSIGGSDLWTAVRESTASSWSTPTNLTSVNSVSSDGRPSLSWDGTTLYFHSNRAGTLGNLDIYVTVRSKKLSWIQTKME